jgi:hypothetical protein
LPIFVAARDPGTARVRLTAGLDGAIYHASGVQREPRHPMFQGGSESAGFAGLKWMDQGIEPRKFFD